MFEVDITDPTLGKSEILSQSFLYLSEYKLRSIEEGMFCVDTDKENFSNSLSNVSDLCKRHETSNLPQESLKRPIENIEEDTMMNRNSCKNTKGFIDTLEPINNTSKVRVDQQGCKYESQRGANDHTGSYQNIPSSMDLSL
jgi:hypothetical protein